MPKTLTEILREAFTTEEIQADLHYILAELYEDASNRVLATAISEASGLDYHWLYNEICGISTYDLSDSAKVADVEQRLEQSGLLAWRVEEI